MNCDILNTIYLKSNGEILCNCDIGEKILLGKVLHEETSWSILDVLTNSKYTHIRTYLSSNIPPWEGICTACPFLRSNEPFRDLLSQRHIEKIQIEPSLSCNLDCPCCNSKSQRKSRPKPFLMKLGLLESLLRSLSQHSFIVKSIEWCGQGEPLMHPQFAELSKMARRYYSGALQRIVTNGNFDYWDTVKGVFLDEIYVSCDGVFQSSYEKYRIGGCVDKVIKFMNDVKKTGMHKHLTWKYILFEFNDDDEELIAAQKLAQSIGVDTLLFVITHSEFKSLKYRTDTVADIPIIYPNVTTNLTPQLQDDNLYENKKTFFKLGRLNSLLKKLQWAFPKYKE